MGGGSSKYRVQTGSQVPIPSWIFQENDLQELIRMNLESFDLQSVIGKGKFGLVYYAQHKTTSKFLAIKFISKKILYETKSRERTQQEINILKMVSHPFIVAFLGGFECLGAISLVFEYAPGGELYTRMKKDGTLSEHATKFYFCEIASAIGYLHSLNIAYRDLKPENILIHANGHVKLCDFGFATVIGTADLAPLHDGCGTAMYVAPEIASGHMKKAHGLPVDWWSLGCILYEMFTGEAPFGDTDKMSKFEIFNNINTAQVSFPLSMGGNLKSLIKGLLEKNQQERFSFSAVKNHPWVSEINWSDLDGVQMTPPWIPSDCQSPNKKHFVEWPGESLPTSCTPQEKNYCSSFDLSIHSRQRRDSCNSRSDPEKSPVATRRRSSESRNSMSLESWKSDASVAPAPRLSEAKSRSSSKLLESSRSSPNRSHSHSRLEMGSSPNRRKTGSDAAKQALLLDDDGEASLPKHSKQHGSKPRHVPVY